MAADEKTIPDAPLPIRHEDPKTVEEGAVFVRECPECHQLKQSADSSGKTPCLACRDGAPAKKPDDKPATSSATGLGSSAPVSTSSPSDEAPLPVGGGGKRPRG